MTRFGDTWRLQPPAYWDKMWASHVDSQLTQRLLELAMSYEAVLEIGAGAGHFAEELRKRGFEGTYLGFEIARSAVDEGRKRTSSNYPILEGDFMCSVHALPHGRDLQMDGKRRRVAIARKVLQHQPHWCPIVIAALRSADVVCAGIGYVEGQGMHDSRLSKTGHYNTKLSIARMEIEAHAMGLDLQLETFADPGRPREAVATFRWAR